MKLLKIHSGDDYAALTFEDEFNPNEVALDMIQKRETKRTINGWIELEIIEVNTPEEMFDLYKNREDYDDSKHNTILKIDE